MPFILLAALSISSALAQDDGHSIKFSVHSDLILLPTRVQDKHGKTIYGLKAEQFMVMTMASAKRWKWRNNPTRSASRS
ncbi:MAG: hypothetical protein WBY44_13035 [Bryobacteraceae bacterium]